jgi:hypothetical protein
MMDKRNKAAIKCGPERMLARFANLGSLEHYEDIAEFQRRYGEIETGLSEHGCRTVVGMFRWAWRAKAAEEKEGVSRLLNFMLQAKYMSGAILSVPGVPKVFVPSPRVVADFGSGKLRIEPESLLHWLVMSLLACRNRLAICKHQGCKTSLYVRNAY